MRQAIGIDIGGTKIRAARVGADGSISARVVRTTPKTPSAVMVEINAVIAALEPRAGETIGLGIPAKIDMKQQRIFPGGFVDLSGKPLGQWLAAARHHHIAIGNDAAMALVGEARLGAARGFANVVLLTIGTGIGGAVMIDGRLVHGRASAGQLGHLTVDVNGLRCLCGRKGCVETTSSGSAFKRLVAEAGLPAATRIEDILADHSDKARLVLDAWAEPLRCTIDSLVATLDPDVVVLGGGLGRAAHQALQAFPPQSTWFRCDVAAAMLGDDAGAIGAALLSMEDAG